VPALNVLKLTEVPRDLVAEIKLEWVAGGSPADVPAATAPLRLLSEVNLPMPAVSS
jgi:hypothetical protein